MSSRPGCSQTARRRPASAAPTLPRSTAISPLPVPSAAGPGRRILRLRDLSQRLGTTQRPVRAGRRGRGSRLAEPAACVRRRIRAQFAAVRELAPHCSIRLLGRRLTQSLVQGQCSYGSSGWSTVVNEVTRHRRHVAVVHRRGVRHDGDHGVHPGVRRQRRVTGDVQLHRVRVGGAAADHHPGDGVAVGVAVAGAAR